MSLVIRITIVSLFHLFLIKGSDIYEDHLLDLKSQKKEYQFELGIENKFAFWSLCIPTQQVSQFTDGENQQLFYIRNNVNQDLIIAMFVSVVIRSPQVSHKIYFRDMIQYQDYNPLQYEGTWILTMITMKKKEISIQTLNSDIIHYYTSLYEIFNIQFVLGDTRLRVQDFYLGAFRGRISQLMMIEENLAFDDYFNNNKIPPKIQGQQTQELVSGIQTFRGETQLKIEIEQVGKNFYISGWAKYDSVDQNSLITYLLLRMSVFKSYTNEIRVGDEVAKILVDIDKSNQFSGYTIVSYHYATPILQYIQNLENEKKFVSLDLKQLMSWHFISFEYSSTWNIKTKFLISYFEYSNIFHKEINLGTEKYNNLFINTKYYVTIGSDNIKYFSKLKGQIFNLQIHYNYDNPKEFIQICHHSCQECKGPSSNDCISCSVNQNRIYIKDFNQCPCQLGYFEDDKHCKSVIDFNPILILKNVESKNQRCPFGYFMLPEDEKCIKCPQEYIRGFDLICAECLQYPTTWYKKLNCQSDYYIQMKSANQFTYRIKQRQPKDYDLYLIDDNFELQYIEGAEEHCTQNFNLNSFCNELDTNFLVSKVISVKCKSNYYHNPNPFRKCLLLPKGCVIMYESCEKCDTGYELKDDLCQEIIQITCNKGYTFSNELNKCIQCGKNCMDCQYQYNELGQGYPRCLRCVHHQKYYISINFTDCLENLIANCLYAFEATQDYKINSFEFDLNINTQSATKTGCARCSDGFFFNEYTQLCQKHTNQQCQYGYQLILYNEMICFYGIKSQNNSPYSFKEGCGQLNKDCKICLVGSTILNEESYSCLICDQGYYSEKSTGQCVPCPLQQYCSNCQQQHKIAKDFWKTEIQAFYRYIIDDSVQSHPFIQYGTSQNSQDYEIICINCLQGYVLHNDMCIKACPYNCLECIIINNENVCIECPTTFNGKSLSLSNNECFLCPSNCELCHIRNQNQIQEVNPLFNNEELSYFSNQCLGFYQCFDNYGFISNDCQQIYQKKEIQINLELICNGENDKLIPEQIVQFQTKDFYLLLNSLEIKTIVIKITSYQQQVCFFNLNQTFIQIYSQNVFYAINVQLEIYGNGFTNFQQGFEGTIQLINFNKIHIEGIIIESQLIQISSNFEQTIELININFILNSIGNQKFIVINNATNIYIDNLNLLQIIKAYSAEVLIEFGYTKSPQVVQISNSLFQIEFTNYQLLRFNFKENDQVEFLNVKLIKSEFISSSLLDLQNGKLIIKEMLIENNTIQNSNLISIRGSSNFISQSFLFNSNSIDNSTILTLNNNINISQIEFKRICYLIIHIQFCQIQQISFSLNTYEYGSRLILFNNDNNQQPNKNLIIKNIKLIGNKIQDISKLLYQEMLIVLEFINISIHELYIQRYIGISEFKFQGVQNLILNKTIIQKYSDQTQEQLFVIFECAKIKGLLNTSIFIEDTFNIEFINLKILNIGSVDYPIINIYQKKSQTQFSLFLKLSQLNFYNNFLLTQEKQTTTGIIYLMSQSNYYIQISDSIFEKNLLHQYQENQLFISSLLFNLDCSLCTIYIKNLTVESNIVTNSSTSIIFLKAKNVIFENSIFQKNCIFDYQILQPFLVFNFDQDQNLLYDIITNILEIKVSSGNAKIIGEQITIKNIQINNSSGSGFNIKMENEAILLIENANFSNLISETTNGGILLIDSSQATSTIITANYISMINIKNKNKGGFIYSLNGKGVTQINLQNLFVENLYSLIGSLFYGDFVASNVETSFIVKNLQMKNSILEQLQFLNTFSNQDESQQSVINQLGSRSLFLISNFRIISLQNLEINQLLYESVLTIRGAQNIAIKNMKIIQSSFLNYAIFINQMSISSKLQFYNISIFNITISSDIISPSPCKINQSNIQNEIKYKCSQHILAPLHLVSSNKNSLDQAYCVINTINDLETFSQMNLIIIYPFQTDIRLSQIKIYNTHCEFGGLLAFYFKDSYVDTDIDSLLIYQNFCGKLGCLIFQNSNNNRILQRQEDHLLKQIYNLKLVNYMCMYNIGNDGTCLYVANLSTIIKSSVLKHNIAQTSGGSITILGNKKFLLQESFIMNNTANFGGGLSINSFKTNQFYKQKSIIEDNIAKLFGNNYAQIPSQLTISFDRTTGLEKVKIVNKENLLIEQIVIKPYVLFKDTYSDTLYVPNGQPLSKYEYFDWTQLKYFKYNMHFRIKAFDRYNVQQQNLENSTCEIMGRILESNNENQFTSNFTNIPKVVFDNYDYNLDDIIVYLDDQLNLTLQLQFQCTSVKIPIYNDNLEIIDFHNNYFLRINLKTLPCQFGETKNQTSGICVLCNATQGWYSLTINSDKCSIKDELKVKEVTSAKLNLKYGFWRPYFNNDIINECINLIDNCNGGWEVGDTSCFQGHVGALCEECDLYNLRGEGHYSTSNKYQCSPCTDQELNSILISLISFWTIISALISVRGTVTLIEEMAIKIYISQFRLLLTNQDSQSGILIKMLTNHLQIVSTITTFKFKLPQQLNNAVNSSANPIQKMTFSLDCFLIFIFSLDIHYSRMIWQLVLPLIYITLFLGCYLIGVFIKFLKYKVSVITTTFIYLYIYVQPNLIGGFIQLISFRQISGFNWIQANVAYRYDTNPHYFWLTTFCLPLLLLIAILIPIILYLGMYFNKNKLNTKNMRQRLGYLYNEYKITAYFWEIVKIFEKELIIIFLSYYDDNIIKKGILVFLTVYLYWELNIKYQPFSSKKLNKLDAYSAQICQLSIIFGLGIYIEQISDVIEIQIPFLIILAYLNIHFLLKLLLEIISQYVKNLEVQLDSIRDFIRTKAPWTLKYRFLHLQLLNRQQQRARVIKKFQILKKHLLLKAKQIVQIKSQYNIFNDEDVKKIINNCSQQNQNNNNAEYQTINSKIESQGKLRIEQG
ncbi:unnamed protein product [Paramecium sonneborni]|uniref:Uncharacterized protein n=1 Tax=Paramecium sonneborni TaxID=65129 RepID=A0A8S1RDM4_9CILI|nr:unnamed protein product [Paramecium sonneborni]